MALVLYGKHALPLAWTVRKGKKEHFSGTDHRLLLQQVHRLIPETASAIFLGNGEFDSVELQKALHKTGFDYVCRTALSTLVEDRSGEASDWGVAPASGRALRLSPGSLYHRAEVRTGVSGFLARGGS